MASRPCKGSFASCAQEPVSGRNQNNIVLAHLQQLGTELDGVQLARGVFSLTELATETAIEHLVAVGSSIERSAPVAGCVQLTSRWVGRELPFRRVKVVRHESHVQVRNHFAVNVGKLRRGASGVLGLLVDIIDDHFGGFKLRSDRSDSCQQGDESELHGGPFLPSYNVSVTRNDFYEPTRSDARRIIEFDPEIVHVIGEKFT